jgi:hypothetical protein
MLLVLHCTLISSGNPTNTSQVELYQANVRVLRTSSSAYAPIWEIVMKTGPVVLVMWECPVLLVVNFFTLMFYGEHNGYLWHSEVRGIKLYS